MEDRDFTLRDSTPITDIYGTKLVNRLSDIFFCIQSGAAEMEQQMCGLPKPSNEGHMEIEIIMASILSLQVEKGIVIQSLFVGDSAFHSVGLTNISNEMDGYLNIYHNWVLLDTIQRYPLLDFIKDNGTLVLKHLDEPDNHGNISIPVFVKDGIERVRCRFVFFEKSEQTVEFIRNNAKRIVIDKTEDGEFLFRHRRDLDWFYDEYMKNI